MSLAWIKDFNSALMINPKRTLLSIVILLNSTFYCLVAAFATTISISPELGIGYLFMKCSGKLRQPANILLGENIYLYCNKYL